MLDLVMVHEGQPVTTSRLVADKFGRRHADVLNTVKNIECSIEFNERNFSSVEYTDAKGEKRPEYILTKDGFTFLVMGFTGKQAAAFKEEYIEAFNAMEKALKEQQEIDLTSRLNAILEDRIEKAVTKALHKINNPEEKQEEKPRTHLHALLSEAGLSMKELCEELDVKSSSFHYRLNKGHIHLFDYFYIHLRTGKSLDELLLRDPLYQPIARKVEKLIYDKIGAFAVIQA